MTEVVLYQIITSFLVGGGTLTLLSVLAERTNKQVSGILMMFPSTIVLGFFFLGITNTPHVVSKIIPATLFPLGILVLSTLIYIHIAKAFSRTSLNKSIQILCTFLSTSAIWFALVIPFALYKVENLLMGILGYVSSILLASYFFSRIKTKDVPVKAAYTKMQIAFRAVFMGTTIATIVFLGKILNPFWGGIFTMYPAATFSALIVLHSHYNPDQLFHFYSNAPLGSLSLFVYCITVMIFFPLLGTVLGTLSAYVVCLIFSVVLIRLQRIPLRTRN